MVIGQVDRCGAVGVAVGVKRIVNHDHYRVEKTSENISYTRNDISLAELSSPVAFTDAALPACIPQNSTMLDPYSGSTASSGEKKALNPRH